MRFMDAFIDELNKLAATNVAAEVAPQYASTMVRKPVFTKTTSADSVGGFFKKPQQNRPSALARQRTGNPVGGKMSLK